MEKIIIFNDYYINLDAVTHIYYDEEESNVVVGLKTGYLFEIRHTTKSDYIKFLEKIKKVVNIYG